MSGIANKEDASHAWVWELQSGEKVWVAIEEEIASSNRFSIEFLEQTSPCEFTALDEIFVPHEMEVKDNWTLMGGQGDSHIVSMEFTDPCEFRRLCFVCQCNERGLVNFFSSRKSDSIIAPRVFRTKDECEAFCRNAIAMHYTVERCDDILKGLKGIARRVLSVRKVCRVEEDGSDAVAISSAVEKILD